MAQLTIGHCLMQNNENFREIEGGGDAQGEKAT